MSQHLKGTEYSWLASIFYFGEFPRIPSILPVSQYANCIVKLRLPDHATHRCTAVTEATGR